MPTAVTAVYGSTQLATQTDVKRTHPDGSIRHAIVSVRLPAITAVAPAQASIVFSLNASGANATGSPIALASVNSAGSPIDYRVEIIEHGVKADGSATAESGKTWTTTLKTALSGTVTSWINGALISEWRARIAPVAAGNPHPGLRVIFDARYQSTNQGRVSIAIENVESTTARGDRTYDLRIYDSNNSLAYGVDNLKHFAQTRHRKVLYFGPGAKEMIAIVDVDRLKTARAIPNYARISTPENTIATKYSAWGTSPQGLFQHSLITAYFPATGGRDDIGPLPGWTASALTSQDSRLYRVMFDQAERASYFDVHYRDASSNDLISIDAHSTITLNTSAAGYSAPADQLPAMILPATTPVGSSVDTAHQPSLVYAPYLVTGDHYYLDELYFWANYNFISQNFEYRGREKGWVNSDQVRGQAWSMRTLGHAAWIAPDSDWQKAYFTTKLTNNFTWYRANVLTTNTLGFWSAGLVGGSSAVEKHSSAVDESTQFALAPWQHNFVAYTFYEICERGYAATDIRDFALGFSTKLFTSDPGYNKYDAPAYYLAVKTGTGGGTFLTSMADIHYHSFANRLTAVASELPYWDDPNGYTSFFLATLSASIDAGIPSANVAYVFARSEVMKHGNTYRQNFVANPTWNIVPFSTVVGLSQSDAPGIYTK